MESINFCSDQQTNSFREPPIPTTQNPGGHQIPDKIDDCDQSLEVVDLVQIMVDEQLRHELITASSEIDGATVNKLDHSLCTSRAKHAHKHAVRSILAVQESRKAKLHKRSTGNNARAASDIRRKKKEFFNKEHQQVAPASSAKAAKLVDSDKQQRELKRKSRKKNWKWRATQHWRMREFIRIIRAIIQQNANKHNNKARFKPWTERGVHKADKMQVKNDVVC